MGYWLTRNPGVYVDCTTGGGGHSVAMFSQLNSHSVLHCLDRDPDAIHFASQHLKSNDQVAVHFHQRPFSELAECSICSPVDGILYDLGVSSYQLDAKERGFSFAGDVPLDLRMNGEDGPSAQQWITDVDERSLSLCLSRNADLPRSYKLARSILASVEEQGALLPAGIRAAVERVFPDKRRDHSSILARIYQAIRMEVNREMDEIKTSMCAAVNLLRPGGHLVVISYHSVEDRTVKQTLAELERDCLCPPRMPCTCGGNQRKVRKVFKKPLLPNEAEVQRNSRSRSAKMRVYERV